MMRLREVLDGAVARLEASPSPRRDAEILLLHVLQRPRTYLFSHPDDVLPEELRACFDALLERRVGGEPVAYLTGGRDFWSLSLRVNEATLIPRPDTELLVETVLALPVQGTVQRVADLGTGSGAIALSLAVERPQWQLVAVDRSEAALAVARSNAELNHIRNVEFLPSDWCANLSGKFSVIVSNPPYIAEHDPHLAEGDVRFEPRTALVSGPDGLDDIRRLLLQVPSCLEAGGWFWLEHGYDQGESVRDLFCAHGFQQVETRRDLGGNERITGGRWLPEEGRC